MYCIYINTNEGKKSRCNGNQVNFPCGDTEHPTKEEAVEGKALTHIQNERENILARVVKRDEKRGMIGVDGALRAKEGILLLALDIQLDEINSLARKERIDFRNRYGNTFMLVGSTVERGVTVARGIEKKLAVLAGERHIQRENFRGIVGVFYIVFFSELQKSLECLGIGLDCENFFKMRKLAEEFSRGVAVVCAAVKNGFNVLLL